MRSSKVQRISTTSRTAIWSPAMTTGIFLGGPMTQKRLAVQAFGKPTIERVGDLSRYAPWRNVPRPLIELWDNAEECYGFTNAVFAIFNRHAMSPAFRPKRMSWLLAVLARLAAPISAQVFVERGDPGESK